jgi:hypothetical protein
MRRVQIRTRFESAGNATYGMHSLPRHSASKSGSMVYLLFVYCPYPYRPGDGPPDGPGPGMGDGLEHGPGPRPVDRDARRLQGRLQRALPCREAGGEAGRQVRAPDHALPSGLEHAPLRPLLRHDRCGLSGGCRDSWGDGYPVRCLDGQDLQPDTSSSIGATSPSRPEPNRLSRVFTTLARFLPTSPTNLSLTLTYHPCLQTLWHTTTVRAGSPEEGEGSPGGMGSGNRQGREPGNREGSRQRNR